VGHISERLLWRISAILFAGGALGMVVTGMVWALVGNNPQFASWEKFLSTGFMTCAGLLFIAFLLAALDSAWYGMMSSEQRMQKKLRQELDDGTFLASCNISQQDK
jgi:hypothetical protein